MDERIRLRSLIGENIKLLIDFGSTFTKLVVVDLNREEIGLMTDYCEV